MYEAFYKLDGKPFRLTPDAGMLFPSKGHTRAMSYLLYGFEQCEGFVMVTGEVGTGKTLLIQHLVEELSRPEIVMACIASANLDGEDILPAVASEFTLPFEGRSKEALLQDVRRHLGELADCGRRALLVVDEAQTLTPAALEMLRILSNLEVAGRALLQVFLVGQSELRGIIVNHRLEQLRQRIIASYRLQAMDVAESRDYILYRLRAVGWDADPLLEPEVFEDVHRASGGIPRKINLIMDRLLLYGYLEERHTLDRGALATVLSEMHEEMSDVPRTLEPTLPVPPSARRGPVAGGDDERGRPPRPDADAPGDLALLEKKYRHMMRQLMREEMRLRKTARRPVPPAPAVAVDDGVVLPGMELVRAGWHRK